MNHYFTLFLGIACAGTGGELFVRGLVKLGRWMRISPAIVGATFAAFATSSPELSVGINAALAGTPQISLGDVLGSNIVNVGLVIGLTLTIGSIRSTRGELKRDFPVALALPVIIGILSVDGVLSRKDGIILLSMFAAWLVAVIAEARRQRDEIANVVEKSGNWRPVLYCTCGLALLIIAGRFIVSGAVGIAEAWGLGTFVIGALIVAVGTSVPELATSVMAKIRGHDEISLGTILGSNIFNCLGIIGVVAVICPIVVPFRSVLLALVFGLVTVIPTYPTRTGIIERWRGFVLLALYVVYVFFTVGPTAHK